MTAELSTPPDSDVPTGTSDRRRMRTEVEKASAKRRCQASGSGERSTAATAVRRFQYRLARRPPRSTHRLVPGSIWLIPSNQDDGPSYGRLLRRKAAARAGLTRMETSG